MNTSRRTEATVRSPVAVGLIALAVAACGASATRTASVAPSQTLAPSSVAVPSPSPVDSSSPPPTSSPAASQEPETGGGTTSGDVPDNAVFLTYRQANQGFSIQYVEGWQVRTQPDGVAINDKDSSETVKVIDLPSDVAAYVTATDLPALQAQPGFKLDKQDTVKVGNTRYEHLRFDALAPADPVTGKRVPSTIDRYYVPGPAHLAIVSLSTPTGVDNVDAFRQMITSFAWT